MSPRDSIAFNDKQLEYDTGVISWAKWLGYAGLLPFIISAMFCFTDNPQWQQLALTSLTNYAAIIITFIGALHWGNALNALKHNSHPQLVLSVIPSLIAWLALFLSSFYTIGIFILLYIVMLIIDIKLWAHRAWFVRLRIQLTIAAILSLSAGMLSLI
jgi:hypothetical protein